MTPAVSQGTQARAAVCGKRAHAIIPPLRENPAAASRLDNRLTPRVRASSQVPWKATRIFKARVASRWCWIGSIRAGMAIGDTGDACGLIHGELPPSSVSDHSGSRPSLRACRTSSSQGRNWRTRVVQQVVAMARRHGWSARDHPLEDVRGHQEPGPVEPGEEEDERQRDPQDDHVPLQPPPEPACQEPADPLHRSQQDQEPKEKPSVDAHAQNILDCA